MINWDEVVSCKDCATIRKAEQGEIDAYIEKIYSHKDEIWYCGSCRSGQNEWILEEMLWDETNEFLVTPCCHSEAAAALFSYDPSAYRKRQK